IITNYNTQPSASHRDTAKSNTKYDDDEESPAHEVHARGAMDTNERTRPTRYILCFLFVCQESPLLLARHCALEPANKSSTPRSTSYPSMYAGYSIEQVANRLKILTRSCFPALQLERFTTKIEGFILAVSSTRDQRSEETP
ncbi:unnamed protein product, partial [Ectocarpus sp. 12 AP-2014]